MKRISNDQKVKKKLAKLKATEMDSHSFKREKIFFFQVEEIQNEMMMMISFKKKRRNTFYFSVSVAKENVRNVQKGKIAKNGEVGKITQVLDTSLHVDSFCQESEEDAYHLISQCPTFEQRRAQELEKYDWFIGLAIFIGNQMN